MAKGWIIRTPSGGYKACYRTPKGKITSQTFPKGQARAAEKFLAANVTAMDRGNWADPQKGRIPLRRYVEETWLPTADGLAESSRARLEIALKTDIFPAFGSKKLKAIGYEDVLAWKTSMAKTKAPASVRKSFYILANVLKTAVRSGYIAVSPCDGVELSKRSSKKTTEPCPVSTKMKTLEAEELYRLVDEVSSEPKHERYAALILTAGWTGLRWSELLGLRVGSVKHVGDKLRQLDVSHGLVEVAGTFYETDLKTESSNRTVEMPTVVADALAAHIDRFCAKRRDGSPDPAARVFTAEKGLQIRRSNFARRVFHPAARRAGLEPLRFHDLRHTAASLSIATGIPIPVVSKMLGHSKVSTTSDIYAHLLKGQERQLADLLDEMANAARFATYLLPEAPSGVVSAPFGGAVDAR